MTRPSVLIVNPVFRMGVIDPVKVTKNALINAVSVSSMLLTTEVVIIEEGIENE